MQDRRTWTLSEALANEQIAQAWLHGHVGEPTAAQAREETTEEAVASAQRALRYALDAEQQDRPSWFGGPANTNPPRQSLRPTWGHSASYDGAYDSRGKFAADARD